MTAPYALHRGDCREVMATMEAESIDALVCDPPYGLGFMGKEWDRPDFTPGDSPMRRSAQSDAVNAGASRQGGRQRAGSDYQKRQARDMRAFQESMGDVFTEALRVAKPGAHLVAFGGSRTFHRLTCAVEDAGWEIRDVLMWVYGSGFPKSLDVSKAIDKEAGAAREVVGPRLMPDGRPVSDVRGQTKTDGWDRPWRNDPDAVAMNMMQTAPATDAARQWSGWGTALKPAYEPIILARKPLRGTVARNVQTFGTGAINVDGCRVGASGGTRKASRPEGAGHGVYGAGMHGRCDIASTDSGRWPANVLLDEAAAAVLDEMSGVLGAGGFPASAGITSSPGAHGTMGGAWSGTNRQTRHETDRGGASRFFYTSKASGKDRGREEHGNDHPTVKPTDLMRWLCRLVTPPGGLILDPFMGSGSTGVAAVEEGFRFVGIDIEQHHVDIAERRLKHAARQPGLFTEVA